jgi:hypothetical protein
MQLLLSGVAHRNQGLFSDYYLDYPDNGLNATPEMCKLIYDNSLTLLYRLLFIFTLKLGICYHCIATPRINGDTAFIQ